MIMKDTEKENTLEPRSCECFVSVLTYVCLVWVFLFLTCTEQGAGQAGAWAPLQETGHRLRSGGLR